AQARRQGDAADGSIALVLFPAGADEIAADDTLDRHDRGLANEHAAAVEGVLLGGEGGGHRGDVDAEEVVRDAQVIEPEPRQAGEDAALVGDAGRQHPVAGADPVAGDDDEAVAEVIDVAHLPATAGEALDVALK